MDPDKLPMLGGYALNATSDEPDSRDWMYLPPPTPMARYIAKPSGLYIMDQKSEGACTGFGLAAVINMLNQQRSLKVNVSPRMLYEMARKYDEWPGEEYSGSSCRGAIKGFASMGVCRESLWPYRDGKPGELSVDAAKDARGNTIGAYYRLRPRISDFHAALNEAGAIFCSAQVHNGWGKSAVQDGTIDLRPGITGGHAFAIVGYTNKGFWVQNSWGKTWGKGGLALWSYEDWYQNLQDAWVLNVALPTPQIWHMEATAGSRRTAMLTEGLGATPRGRIAGHFVHMDDGQFHDAGRYWSNRQDVATTAANLAQNRKYDHLLLYAHGGLNSPKASAQRIAAMREVFKENRIYPYHIMYDTGVLEELKDVISSRGKRTDERVGGDLDWWDKMLERLARRPGRALWREMKYGAREGFRLNNAGVESLQILVDALRDAKGMKVDLHLAGHSTGGIVMAYLLEALEQLAPSLRVKTCSLMAPAGTVDLYRSHYHPRLVDDATPFGIEQMTVYNLSDKLELDDSVGPYRKSLLYFVSHAFEEDTPAPILGMQLHSKSLEALTPRLEFVYSEGDSGRQPRSLSTSHGGFDNDPATMNDILFRVLGKKPRRPFTAKDLDY
ncbi:peptidase C1 [Mangrovimicrobium sediminis]|uniref:Peptidase C1 n=1 Tax=Mangrovimicrobium sediminis TaxID=2562682 RepID=A0A4Z0M221_9GAMM|nr:C1 family peptidase [Haliea sp. SAOS-164]TGD73486.1 peptidase C1 [Haliea sp. SAOS-164]